MTQRIKTAKSTPKWAYWAQIFCAFLLLTITSTNIASAITLSAPDFTYVDEPSGYTTTTDGTIIDIPNGTVITPGGDVFDYTTGDYTPFGFPTISLDDPGGAVSSGSTMTAPDGTRVIEFLPGQFRVITPDNTRFDIGTTIIRTPTFFDIDFGAVTVTNAVGTLMPTTTAGPVALQQAALITPSIASNATYLSASQSSGIFEAFDDPLDITDNTATTHDDMTVEVQAWRPAITAGFPIIIFQQLNFAYTSFIAQFPAWAPYTFIDEETFCSFTFPTPITCPGPIIIAPPPTPIVPPPPSGVSITPVGVPSTGTKTADVLGLVFAQLFEGGEQAVNNWNSNWTNEILPDYQDMTKQWYTAELDRVRNVATTLDSEETAKRTLDRQEADFKALEENDVSQVTCSVGTQSAGLGRSGHIARGITRGFSKTVQETGLNSVGSPTEFGSASDTSARWQLYSRHFCDTNSNRGDAVCADPGPTHDVYQYLLGAPTLVAPVQLTNADISIENFLLKDSLNMNLPEVKMASYAILRNLVSPNTLDPIINTDIENDPDSRALFLKRREQQALKDVSAAVISSMIGRRTSVPGTDPGVAGALNALRQKAGVPAADISNQPSYNETMLALTKERFYDPDYFYRIGGFSETEIRQEQYGIDVLTSVLQQDIYELQEQMSVLLAARASATFNRDATAGDVSDEMPN